MRRPGRHQENPDSRRRARLETVAGVSVPSPAAGAGTLVSDSPGGPRTICRAVLDASWYRARAQEIRSRADELENPQHREIFLEIAQNYEALAQAVDEFPCCAPAVSFDIERRGKARMRG